MTFAYPQALLLLVPVAVILWLRGLTPGVAGLLRVGGLLSLVVALAHPGCVEKGAGADVIVVVDRSRSMPPGSDRHAEELIRDVESKARPGDRVGIVTFGRTARVERAPAAGAHFNGFQREIDPDGSDLAAALNLALEIVPPEREAHVLVLSDGLAGGAEVRRAGLRFAQRGAPVDYRLFSRDASEGDVAVRSLDLPAQVSSGEPFEFSANVFSTSDRSVPYVLRRGQSVLAHGTLAAHRGDNTLTFRDRIDGTGIGNYFLDLDVADSVPENNHGHGVVRANGGARVLVVRSDGRKSALTKALEESSFRVEATDAVPRTLDALEGVGVVVLENVPADTLGTDGMETLARFVRDAGGGLLMTGGLRSFGQGGYHLSPLENILPVSLEVREEQHRAHVALGVSMDRSGSMGVLAADGRPKIKLAAEGTIAALKMLSKGDQAAVWVVDTKAHVLFPLTPVEDGLSLDLVAEIESQGGGIYIGEALSAAADELAHAQTPTRHLLLFADANDSEEPADYRESLARMKRNGITVSVIGMGTEQDKDAELLREIARLGDGQIYFSDRVSELPRLFAEDTILVARASFVDTPTGLAVAPDLAMLGAPEGGDPPKLGGYNLTYARPNASVALRTSDENAAPVLAFWTQGAGHAAAFTGEADGQYSGGLNRWAGFRSLFSRLVRRLLPAAESGEVLAKSRLDGDDLHVTVEVDDTAAARSAPATVTLVSGDGTGEPVTVPMEWEDAHRLGAHFPLASNGTWFPLANVAGHAYRVAPVALPYPAELEPHDPAEGRALLEDLAQLTGGVERLAVGEVFDAKGPRAGWRPFDLWFAWAALFLLLGEVTIRRLVPGGIDVPLPPLPRMPRRRRRERAAVLDKPVAPEEVEPPPAPAEPVPASGMQSAIEQARERARRRLD